MKSARLFVLVLLTGLAASGSEGGILRTKDVRRAVEGRDFFVYSCVREFSKTHAFPLYDSSTDYVVQHGRLSPEEMSRIYDAAQAFARTLRTPDPTDEDHGGVPVLAQCLEEARSARVDALLRKKRNARN
jgi:hypothetical protein